MKLWLGRLWLIHVPPGSMRRMLTYWNCSACRKEYNALLKILKGAHQSVNRTCLSKFLTCMTTWINDMQLGRSIPGKLLHHLCLFNGKACICHFFLYSLYLFTTEKSLSRKSDAAGSAPNKYHGEIHNVLIFLLTFNFKSNIYYEIMWK
jgi:hypothetical protein